MAYDEQLAQRVRAILVPFQRVTERKMFGGLAFLMGGHMCCGVVGDYLMVRVGREGYGLSSDGDLRAWVERGARFVETLPVRG
jgi:TfoX/Sxy family transcriptional regulator of competence genes